MVLPQSMRLKGYRCFDLIYRHGKRYHGNFMIIRVAKSKSKLLKASCKINDHKACRFGVAISSKVSKKAVVRNALRRLFHQHLRDRLDDKKMDFNSFDNELEGIGKTVMAAGWYVKE